MKRRTQDVAPQNYLVLRTEVQCNSECVIGIWVEYYIHLHLSIGLFLFNRWCLVTVIRCKGTLACYKNLCAHTFALMRLKRWKEHLHLEISLTFCICLFDNYVCACACVCALSFMQVMIIGNCSFVNLMSGCVQRICCINLLTRKIYQMNFCNIS